MRRIATGFIVFYWAAFFGLLAGISTLDPARGMVTAFGLIGADPDPTYLPGAPLAAAFSLFFAVAAVLFAWALVSIALGNGFEEAELAAIAFGGGAGALSLMLVIGLLVPILGAAQGLAFQMAAMTASYLVLLQFERMPRPVVEALLRKPAPVRTLPFMARRPAGTDTGEFR